MIRVKMGEEHTGPLQVKPQLPDARPQGVAALAAVKACVDEQILRWSDDDIHVQRPQGVIWQINLNAEHCRVVPDFGHHRLTSVSMLFCVETPRRVRRLWSQAVSPAVLIFLIHFLLRRRKTHHVALITWSIRRQKNTQKGGHCHTSPVK